MSRLASYLSFVLLFLVLTASAFAKDIKRFVVVVPIYRELYSQNIGLLLQSLYAQNLDGLSFSKVDVYFIVNHTTSASDAVKAENVETVEFLNTLAEGKEPAVRDEHAILKAVAKSHVSDKINIHVVDMTRSPPRERNIGYVRDVGIDEVLKSVPYSDRSSTIIAQMDGDSRFLNDYVKRTTRAFEIDSLQFGLTTMYYADQPGEVAQVYRRKITTDFHAAAYEFRIAADGDLPYTGGPRILATAEAMKDVGGVPHSLIGEDGDLIKKLKSRYRNLGRFIDAPVFANYRAREDSYDGNYYLQQLNDPIEFQDYDLESIPILEKSIRSFNQDPLLKVFFEEAVSVHMQEYLRNVRQLKNLIPVLIDEIASGDPIVKPASGFPALLNNPWFFDRLRSLIAHHGESPQKILEILTQEFPYYLSDPALKETKLAAQFKAATQTYQIKRYVGATRWGTTFLSLYRDKMPVFIDVFGEFYFKQIRSRWDNLTPEGFSEIYRDEKKQGLRDLRELLKAKNFPNYEAIYKPYLHQVVIRFLDAVRKQKKSLEPLADLVQEVDYDRVLKERPVDYSSARALQQDILKSWSTELERVKKLATPNEHGKYWCPTHSEYHSREPNSYSGKGWDAQALAGLMDELNIVGDAPISKEAIEILAPLVNLYKQALGSRQRSVTDRVRNRRYFEAAEKLIPQIQIDWTTAHGIQKELLKNWSSEVEYAKKLSTSDGRGNYWCPKHSLYHSEEPHRYEGNGLNAAHLNELVAILNPIPGGQPPPEATALLAPLVELYEQALKMRYRSFTDKLVSRDIFENAQKLVKCNDALHAVTQ